MAVILSAKRKRFVLSALLAATFIYSGSAHAQLEQQTGIADPGLAEQRLTEERLVPQGGPNITVKSMAIENAPAGAENIRFNFGGLEVQGAQVYSDNQLYSFYKNMIGQEVSLADVYAVANRMTLKYREDGYILTRVVVPPQTIENGIPKVQVVEGFIDKITIQGEGEPSSAMKTVEAYANKISTGGATNIADLERQLLLINDLPGLEARSIISPSATTSGAADLLIIVERDPFEALLSVDNYGSKFLGPWQFGGAAIANSILGMNEQITLQTVLAPDSGMELALGSVRYEQPIGRAGTTIAIGGGITATDPGYTLSQFEVEGLSQNFYIGAEHPFVRSRETNIFGRLTFDLRNVDSQNNVELTREDRIRALRAGLKIDHLDRLIGVAVNTLDFEVSRGIDVFGASNKGAANLTRADGDPTFTKANLRVERLQRLSESFNLLIGGRGQLSNNALLSSEEFSLGGINTVRGYDPSEVTGDDGIAGKVELQWDTPQEMIQVYGFIDSGTVWNEDATTSADKRSSLTSTGAGVRLDLPMEFDVEFTAAKPLNEDVQTHRDRDMRYFVSVQKRF